MLLLKDRPKRAIFEEDEQIRVNLKFASNAIRNTVIPAKVTKKKTVQPSVEEIHQMSSLNESRKYRIQCQIVKVMKAQKRYKVVNLKNDVIASISMFKPDPAMIKEQIDRLIERDYMTRDDKDRTVLIYVP